MYIRLRRASIVGCDQTPTPDGPIVGAPADVLPVTSPRRGTV
jgi:hypothetical protein